MPDRHVADICLDDDCTRAVFEQPNGRQYVLDDEGAPMFGVWFIPPDDADVPVIVEE